MPETDLDAERQAQAAALLREVVTTIAASGDPALPLSMAGALLDFGDASRWTQAVSRPDWLVAIGVLRRLVDTVEQLAAEPRPAEIEETLTAARKVLRGAKAK